MRGGLVPGRHFLTVGAQNTQNMCAHGGGGPAASFFASRPALARWHVLSVYTLFAALQGMIWALPGAVQNTYAGASVYHLSGDTIQLLLNYGPIFYLLCALPVSWHLDRFGLRGAVLSGVCLVGASCLLRLFANDGSPASLALLHASFILNALAGPISMGAVGKISEDFFPPSERGTATAWASEANPFGAAIAFILAPAMTPVLDMAHVQRVNWLLLGVAAVNFGACALYLPAHPAAAPSASAHSQRAQEARFSLRVLARALGALARSRAFLLLCAAYGLSAGFSSGWASTLQTNLAPFLAGYSDADVQWKAGLISFASTTAGNVAGVVLGSYIDRFRGHKALLVALNGLGAAFFAVFALVAGGSLQALWPPAGGSAALGYSVLFWSGLLGGLFCNAAIPLYFELALEAAFPLPSGTVITILTTMVRCRRCALHAHLLFPPFR